MAHILLVEDSPSHAVVYQGYLETLGHAVTHADTGKAALEVVQAPGEIGKPDLMVLDLGLPDMDGQDLLKEMGGASGAPPTIVLTSTGSVRRAVDVMKDGAIDFLLKPCAMDRFLDSVRDCLERRQPMPAPEAEAVVQQAEAKADVAVAEPDITKPVPEKKKKRGPSGFIGQSPAMSNVFGLIEAAGGSSASVFITGETGTGKELCASAIHAVGARRNGPFVPLNCAAIPKDLIESEIFGHRKGSFTGAVDDREGAASRADGGTLFLDELCEMDLGLQSKLLRFIQSGTYRRVGEDRDRVADIRFVCATNRDPLLEVAEGRFREDLYYRLYVVPIHMPPLRDRASDVTLLAQRFLQDFARLEGKQFQDFAPDALAAILSYPWPGNVRQLENAMRTIVVLHDGAHVTRDMLPPQIRGEGAVMSAGLSSPPPPAGEDGATLAPTAAAPMEADQKTDLLLRPLVELEMMAIDTAIAHFDGNVTKAARVLGISTSTIYRKQQAWAAKSKS